MKNLLIFPENCRLANQQRRTLEQVLTNFPMDILTAEACPNLVFSKKTCSSLKQISGSFLTPDIQSLNYTIEFTDKVEFKREPFKNSDLLSWRYELFTSSDQRSRGTLMYCDLWASDYTNIFPAAPYTFRISLEIPLNQLIDTNGNPLFIR